MAQAIEGSTPPPSPEDLKSAVKALRENGVQMVVENKQIILVRSFQQILGYAGGPPPEGKVLTRAATEFMKRTDVAALPETQRLAIKNQLIIAIKSILAIKYTPPEPQAPEEIPEIAEVEEIKSVTLPAPVAKSPKLSQKKKPSGKKQREEAVKPWYRKGKFYGYAAGILLSFTAAGTGMYHYAFSGKKENPKPREALVEAKTPTYSAPPPPPKVDVPSVKIKEELPVTEIKEPLMDPPVSVKTEEVPAPMPEIKTTPMPLPTEPVKTVTPEPVPVPRVPVPTPEKKIVVDNSPVAPPYMRALKSIQREYNTPEVQALIRAVVKRADTALQSPLLTLNQNKPRMPEGATKHDYVSTSYYLWPNPNTPNGLPYIKIDGKKNPETKEYDAPALDKMSANVTELLWAYCLTGNERYAQQASMQLRVWFIDKNTRMNPNLTYAHFTPGGGLGRGTGIIDTDRLPVMVDALPFLRKSPSWRAQDQKDLEQWFREYRDWLVSSNDGKREAAKSNNHGTWYRVQVATYSQFINDPGMVRQVLEYAKEDLGKQITPEGDQPEEDQRAAAKMYNEFNVNAWVTLAEIGDRAGIDLYRHDPDGKGKPRLQAAIKKLADYAVNGKIWPHGQIKTGSPDQLAKSLFAAAPRYDMRYLALADQIGKVSPLDKLRYRR